MICRVATLGSGEQATEDPVADLERFRDGGSRALKGRVRVSPRPQMLFRPEEVDRRSERVEGLARLVTARSDPHHYPFGGPRHPIRRCRERQGLTAVMAGRRDLDGFSDHRRDAERVGRATGEALAGA